MYRKDVTNISKLLNPKSDYVFKRIFGHVGNEEITKGLLKAITREEIQEIELDSNPITEKELLDDKVGILDIKAKLNNNVNCNIEVQLVDRKNIEKRILFYWSKMYTSSIKAGRDYNTLEKTIEILITDYNIQNLQDLKDYITKWNIRETKNPHKILTDMLEIYIIELNKVSDIGNKDLNSWLKFINNPEEKLDMENKEIKKAKEILEEISQDEHERYLAELREKYIMDQKAIEEAGYDKGLKSGIEQGKKETQIEIAKKMKEKKVDYSTIIEVTGITEEDIKKL